MKNILLTSLVISLTVLMVSAQQPQLELTGQQFFAISVSNTDSASAWYQRVFNLKLLKEIKPPNTQVHIRILGNDNLQVEIGQLPGSRTLTDCGLTEQEAHKMRGFFKVGFFVKDVESAERYFADAKVKIRHQTFEDSDTGTRSFIIEDLHGNMLQILQRK